MIRSCLLVALLLVSASASAQEAATIGPAVALDPIDGIADALRSHSVAALAEGIGHGNEQGHAFLVTLLRDPRFSSVADDIVVEWGNSLYQDVIDRFTRGEDVPYRELRQVWEKTTQPGTVWDRPVYREFFEAVRARNATLPEAERIRVLLGDPPVDWELIASGRADLEQFGRARDAYPAELIQKEVIAKGRRALIVYGGLHLTTLSRRRDVPEDLAFLYNTLVMRLESQGTEVFNIWVTPVDVAAKVDASVSDWEPIRLTHIANTPLGMASFQQYFAASQDSTPMQQQFDALLLLGPQSTMTFSPLSPELCTDEEYLQVRTRQLRIEDVQDFVRRECGTESDYERLQRSRGK